MSFLINGWRLDSSLNGITHAITAETKRLGEYQFALLSLLLEHPDQVLTREVLTQHVWKSRVVGHNSLPNAIHALRHALGDDGKQQQIIKTIPKKGYLLNSQFLTEDHDATVVIVVPVAIPEAPIPDVAKADEPPLPPRPDAPSPVTVPQPATPRYHRGRWIALLVFIVLLLSATAYVLRHNTPDKAAQVKDVIDSRFSAKYTQVFTVQMPYEIADQVEENPLPVGLQNQLTRLDAELEKHQARMQIRYHVGINLLTLNLRLISHCNVNTQLLMEVHNWAQYPDKLAPLIYNESMRNLNDLPPCP